MHGTSVLLVGDKRKTTSFLASAIKRRFRIWTLVASVMTLLCVGFGAWFYLNPSIPSESTTASSSGLNNKLDLGIKAVSPGPAFTVVASLSSESGDYYCTGDDDDIVINAAIKNLEGSGMREIILTEGVFTIGQQLFVKANVRIRGAGMSKTIIKIKDNPPVWKYAGMVRGYRTDNIQFSGFTLDGNRAGISGTGGAVYGRYGFYCEVCDQIVFEDVRITNQYGYGFDPHGEPGTYAASTNLRIENCMSDDNGWDGITIDKTTNTLILNTVVKDNGRHGINIVTGSINTQIKYNTIEGNGFHYYKGGKGNGIMVQDNEFFNTRNTYIVGNTITRSSARGININDSYEDRVEQNIVDQSASDAGDCGRFHNTTNLQVYDNTCTGGAWVVDGPSVNLKTNEKMIGSGAPTTPTTTTSSSSSAPTPDPKCEQGIRVDKSGVMYCCPKSCAICLGSGCGSASCCASGITALGNSCAVGGAPCLDKLIPSSPATTTTTTTTTIPTKTSLSESSPDPNCDRGIRVDKSGIMYCCPTSCPTCVGTGCGSVKGSSATCCSSGILALDTSCAVGGAPCFTRF